MQFSQPEQYDELLNRGLSLSGENKAHFMAGRIQALVDCLPRGFRPCAVLDFGCGTGETAQALARQFTSADVVGTDTSPEALDYAARHNVSPRVSFCETNALKTEPQFDLCYINGVFHHIPLAERLNIVRRVRQVLRPGGYLAFFENNPLNPGTRLIMRRIPFDRDAIPLTHWAAVRLLREGGFQQVMKRHFLFFFPHGLSFLRRAEPCLVSLPIGAQYLILARNVKVRTEEKS